MDNESMNSESAYASAASTIAGGASAIKSGMEQYTRNYDSVLTIGKDTAEAMMRSATIAGKGAEAIHSELHAYSIQSMDDTMAATKAIMGSKSLHEAFELQTEYARKSFEAYFGELTKVREILATTMTDGYAPFEVMPKAWAISTNH